MNANGTLTGMQVRLGRLEEISSALPPESSAALCGEIRALRQDILKLEGGDPQASFGDPHSSLVDGVGRIRMLIGAFRRRPADHRSLGPRIIADLGAENEFRLGHNLTILSLEEDFGLSPEEWQQLLRLGRRLELAQLISRLRAGSASAFEDFYQVILDRCAEYGMSISDFSEHELRSCQIHICWQWLKWHQDFIEQTLEEVMSHWDKRLYAIQFASNLLSWVEILKALDRLSVDVSPAVQWLEKLSNDLGDFYRSCPDAAAEFKAALAGTPIDWPEVALRAVA